MSDTVSNSIRVVKTSKQAATEAVTYPAVIRDVVAKDGVLGLFGRGLKTKILANGLQARGSAALTLTRIGHVAVLRAVVSVPCPLHAGRGSASQCVCSTPERPCTTSSFLTSMM